MNKELFFVAKKNTWSKEGTRVKLINKMYTDSSGINVGLFEGIRNLDNNLDEEICFYDEFYDEFNG